MSLTAILDSPVITNVQWGKALTSRSRCADLETLRLQPEERAFLERRCPYFPESYLDYLSNFRLRPDDQVKVEFVPNGEKDADGTEWGGFDLEIHGLWTETILYEVRSRRNCQTRDEGCSHPRHSRRSL